jgi:RNA ligase (TIGR02306 family)
MENNGSLFKVPVTTIRSIRPHPKEGVLNLEIAKIYGFEVVVRKNIYHEGQLVVYVPVDSVFSPEIEHLCFPPGSKMKLNNSRLRQARIQGFPSQGMIIGPEVLIKYGITVDNIELEKDLQTLLGISKYEPPVKVHETRAEKRIRKRDSNPHFHQYNGVSNIKWSPDYFEGKEVVVQEKLHGSNVRAGYLPAVANTFWRKVKKFFGRLPEFEYVWGSNLRQLQQMKSFKGYYDKDVYKMSLDSVNAFSKLKEGETIFGEVIGQGIQKNYHYGHKDPTFVLFDVKVLQEDGSHKWLDPEEVETYAKERGFPFVPVLYKGIWDKEKVEATVSGSSIYYPKHAVREGVVIKLRKDYDDFGNKTAYKFINPTYLDDKSNSDDH